MLATWYKLDYKHRRTNEYTRCFYKSCGNSEMEIPPTEQSCQSCGQMRKFVNMSKKVRLRTVAVIVFMTILTIVSYLVASLLYPWRGIVPFDPLQCAMDGTTQYPKVVHRIWDQKIIPEKYTNYLQSCEVLNPDYKVIIWNETTIERFLENNYPSGYRLYLQYPKKVNRYDAARYFIIHHYGGIYLDMDMNCTKDFDHIIQTAGKNNVILGEAFPFGVVSNFMIAHPKTQFFAQVIQNLANMKDEKFVLSLYETFVKTGPLFLWKNYFNFPCKDQIHVLSKFKIRGKWLSHDGAGTWQNSSGVYVMFISNSWAAVYYFINYILFTIFFIIVCVIYYKMRHKN